MAGNYFLIILLIIMFGMLYVYVDNYSSLREKFSSSQQSYIIPQENLAIIQGLGMPTQPIEPVTQYDKDPSAATIDGKPDSPSQMFMLAFNKVSPNCCPSPYSTSQGCVCMTDDQINWLSQRGNNSRFSKCQQPIEY